MSRELPSNQKVPSPYKLAWDDFEREHDSFFGLETLTPGPYLRNRLMRAFEAGWLAAEEQSK